MKIRFKIMLPLLFALMLLMVAFVWNDSHRRRAEINESLSKVATTVEKLIASEIRADIEIMGTALDSLTRDPVILKEFQRQDRDFLLAYNQAAFQRLKEKNEITHFYFHRLDRRNFLRMHEPHHFDDKIERKTLKECEETGRPSHGVEQGPTGASVLRVVYPVIRGGKHIGYMELGKEFQDIVHKIETILGLKVLVLAEKTAVKRDKWEKRNNKTLFTVSWDFLPEHVVMASTLPVIPEDIRRLRLDSSSSKAYLQQGLRVSEGTKIYDVIVMPYFVTSKVADILLLYDSSHAFEASQRSAWITFTAVAAIVFSLLGFFHIFLGKVETFLTKQQAALISSSKMASLGEMAGGVAHEINTPLAAIMLNAEMLLDMHNQSSKSDSEITKRLQSILDIGNRISRIVSGLKGFSRDGKDDPFQTFTAGELVASTLDLCAEKFKNRGVKIEVQSKFMDHRIEGQMVGLSQALLNLLNNAFDAVQGSTNPWIRIEAQLSSDRFEISVTDSGNGIPANVAEKIFQPFFTTKDVGVGTGLGLSISKGILQNHGGDLLYDPTSKNTRFCLRLPVAQKKKSVS